MKRLLAVLMLFIAGAASLQAQFYIKDIGDKLWIYRSSSVVARYDKSAITGVDLVGTTGMVITARAPQGRSFAFSPAQLDTSLFVRGNPSISYPPLDTRENIRNWILVAAGQLIWNSGGGGGSVWTAAGSNAYYNIGKTFIGPGTPAYPGILNLRGVGNDEATDVLYVTNLANDFVFSVRESKFAALTGNQPTLVLNHISGTTTGVTSAINFKYNNTTRGFLGLYDQEMVISSIGLGDVHVGANSLVVDDGGLRVVGALAAQDWFGVVPNEGRVYVGSAPGTATAFTVQTPPGTRVGAAVAVDNITIAGDRTGMIVENSGSHTGDNYGIKITVGNPGTGASIPMRIEQPGTVAGSYLVATNVGGDMALRVRPYAYFGSAPGTTPIHTLPNADVTDGWVDFLTTADPGDFGAVNYSSEMTISSTGRVTYNGAQPRRFLCSWTVNVGGDYSAGPSSIAELASLLNGTTINDQSRALAYVHNNTGPHIAHSEFIVELAPGDYLDPVIKVYSAATTNTLDIYSWHFTITTAD